MCVCVCAFECVEGWENLCQVVRAICLHVKLAGLCVVCVCFWARLGLVVYTHAVWSDFVQAATMLSGEAVIVTIGHEVRCSGGVDAVAFFLLQLIRGKKTKASSTLSTSHLLCPCTIHAAIKNAFCSWLGCVIKDDYLFSSTN